MTVRQVICEGASPLTQGVRHTRSAWYPLGFLICPARTCKCQEVHFVISFWENIKTKTMIQHNSSLSSILCFWSHDRVKWCIYLISDNLKYYSCHLLIINYSRFEFQNSNSNKCPWLLFVQELSLNWLYYVLNGK